MSAASVQPPLTTTYIQSPDRFSGTSRVATNANSSTLPTIRTNSSSGVRQLDGRPPRVIDAEPNPISLDGWENPFTAKADALAPTRRMAQQTIQQQQHHSSPYSTLSPARSPPKGRRVNPNSRTSAGFPLAVTSQQAAEEQARKQAIKDEWEYQQQAYFEHARLEAEREEAERLEKKAAQQAEILRLSPTRRQGAQRIDSKLSYRDRPIPPKPDFPEDPLTAYASEHTGNYPGPLNRAPTFVPTGIVDDEPCAPEGTAERYEQKLRSNPLLDPTFQGKSDAAGLGYGRKHPAHFRYISHWIVPDKKSPQELTQSNNSISGYRSKAGLGYQEFVKGIGWGYIHPFHPRAVSVRSADDVLKDYPNGLHCLKLYNRTK